MTKTYDAFISYSTRRDRLRARALAKYLAAAGYSVWFDEAVLGRRSRPTPVRKDDVCKWLQTAISESRCVLLFLIEAEAVPQGDLDVEQALENKQVMWMMKDSASPQLIAWNWQQFELSHAEQWISVSGRAPEDVAKSLVALGIEARPTSTKPGSSLRSRLRAFVCWLRRRNRVRRLFAPFTLDPADADACAIFGLVDAAHAVASNFGPLATRNSVVPRVVVASDSRRTTELTAKLAAHLVQAIASFGFVLPSRPNLPIYVARLPARNDLAAWSDHLNGFPADSLFLITEPLEAGDEPDAQLLYYYERLWRHVWESGKKVILCLPEEVKEALLTAEYPKEGLDQLGTVELASVPSRLVPGIRCSDLDLWHAAHRLSEKAGLPHVDTHILAQLARLIPVTESRQPPSYPNLPSRWLSKRDVVAQAVRALFAAASTAAIPDRDAAVAKLFELFVSWTGISPLILRPSYRATPRSAATVRAAVEHRTALGECGLTDNDISRLCWNLDIVAGNSAMPVLCVSNGDDLLDVAGRVAGALLGNSHAVLHLDYASRRLQDIAWLPTEELRLALHAVGEYPFWVLAIDSPGLAPRNDHFPLAALTDPDRRSAEDEFRRCVIVTNDASAFDEYATVLHPSRVPRT